MSVDLVRTPYHPKPSYYIVPSVQPNPKLLDVPHLVTLFDIAILTPCRNWCSWVTRMLVSLSLPLAGSKQFIFLLDRNLFNRAVAAWLLWNSMCWDHFICFVLLKTPPPPPLPKFSHCTYRQDVSVQPLRLWWVWKDFHGKYSPSENGLFCVNSLICLI